MTKTITLELTPYGQETLLDALSAEMIKMFTLLSIGIDSFKDALYWRNENEMPAFWVELNSGYYQLHPKEYAEIMLREGYADVVYTIDGVYAN